jgi:predicted nucleic acid-binding protein
VITALDTSVLLDVFGADQRFGSASREALRRCIAEGGLAACEIVWAEVAGSFATAAAAAVAMSRLGVEFDPMDESIALAAGDAWRAYRSRGGRRQRMIADFLIGAHARARSDRLLTRDRGFYRTYFEDVVVLDPSA